MIALISFGIFVATALIDFHVFKTEDERMQNNKVRRNTQELTERTDETQKEVEIIVTPKNGKKLKVMGNNITFSIGEISRDTMNIIIPLHANRPIPLKGFNPLVKMRIVMAEGFRDQIIESRSSNFSGLMVGVDLSDTEKGGELLGSIHFTFPTSKIPKEILVYNEYNRSIEFKVKEKK